MYCYLIIVILITSVKSDFSPGTADSIQSSTKGDASPPGKEADSTKSTNNADTSDAGKEAESTKSTNNADTSNAGKEADSTKSTNDDNSHPGKEADSTKSTNNADTSNAGKEADSTKKEADSTKSTNNADTSDAGKEVDSTDSTNTNTASLDGKSQSDSTYSPNNYYNNRQISHAGPTLYVGTWGESVHNTNQSTVVECTKSPLSNYNNTDYETDVAVYTNPDKLFPNKTIFHSYFSFTRKEVWNCTNESENITFVRIVNELVGKKEFFELKYVDGITVSTKTFLDTARTAKIREIKYYDRLNSRAVTYHGKVNLMSNALNNAPTYNLKSVILTKQRTDKGNGYFTEVTFALGENQNYVSQVSTKGPSLVLGSFPLPKDRIGDSSSSAICKSLQGSNPFPAEFRPKLALNVTKWKTSLLVPLSHKEVLEHFTIINEQVWLCNTDENKKFYRIRSEAMSAEEVGQITYSDGIIELHVINLDSISNITKQGIKFTEVKYKSFEEKRAIIYEGSLLLREPEEGLPISRNGERIRDTQYILEENRIFKSFISGRGINIRIGMHWESIVPQSDQNFICKTEMNGEPIKFLDTYLTKMSVLVMENGIYNAEHIKRDEMASYFNHTHEEVWSCSNGTYSFLRIVNELTARGEFLEIEYYDGVELFQYSLSDGRKSVRVFEIKYLDPSTLEVLKYEGEIKLEPGDEFTREHGSPKFGSSGDAIARSDEDIYWIISSLIESLEEKEPTQDHSLEKQIKSDGITLEVSFRDDSKPLEKENKTIECLPLDGIVFQTKIRIKKENEITVLREHNTGDYMKLISRQAWKCSDHQNYVNHEFKRIVSDWQVSLDKLKNVQYSDSVDVWYEMDPSGNVTMRLRETFYFQEKKTGRRKIDRIPVKYEGRVILNRAKSEKISGTVLMETMKKFQFTGPVSVPKTYYNLERDRRYYMAGTKYKTLEIGEKWKVVYGDARTNVVCKKKPDEMKGISQDTGKMLEGADLRAIPTMKLGDAILSFNGYFVIKGYREWECKKGDEPAFNRTVWRYVEQIAEDGTSQGITDNSIYYYDGLQIIDGYYGNTRDNEREFAFQEITYTDDNSQKLKYVGTLEVEGGGAFEEEFVDTLFDPSKKEVQFILDNNEIHYMDFGEEGPAVEFGERSHGDVHESIKNVKCKIFKEKREFKYRPRAAFHHVREQKIHFTNMDDETFHKYFDIISKTWICSRRGHDTDGEIVFYKEQNTMLSKLPISRLFFHDGVRAELDNDRIKIREINFRSLDGLTSLKYTGSVVYTNTQSVENGAKIREFDYLLDIPKLYSIALKGDGAALEVGSRWQEQVTINSTDGFDYADPTFTCELEPPTEYKDSYRIRVAINSVNETDNTYKSHEMDKTMLSHYFKFWTQQVYNCTRNMRNFKMIVNVLQAKKGISRLYYHNGITVESTMTFSGIELVKVTEVKYMDPLTLKILKYDGNIKTTKNQNQRTSYLNNEEWSNIVNSATGAEPLLNFNHTRTRKRIVEFHSRAGETIEVGAPWKVKFDSEGQKMLCMVDKDIPTDSEPLMTKVIVKDESYGYSLDKDIIKTFFDIESKCWVCVCGTGMFLRVESKLVAKKSISCATLHDGVTITKNDTAFGEAITIEEIKYFDRKTFDQIRYDGELVSANITEILRRPEFQKMAEDILHIPENLLLTTT